MHQRKNKKILIYFFLLIIVSSIGNNKINNYKFKKIENINIFGLDEKNNQILLNKLKNLNLGNIFFINKKKIEKLINSNSLIESYVIFKEYPSTLNIKIEKTNFFAKMSKNSKIFFIGSNGRLTLAENPNNELPYIFGKPNIKEFLKFKQIIDKSKFNYKQIDKLYFFPSNRWDIKLKENILLKLPANFTLENLDHLYEFLKNNNVKKFSVIDFRIQDQIILNE